MSRSKNETSVPRQRGRAGVKKDKRLSNKKIRKMEDETDRSVLNKVKKDIVLDKDQSKKPWETKNEK